MANQVIRYKVKAGVTSIQVRLLEIMDDDSWVIKKDEHHKDGYYEFLIEEKFLNEILACDNQKEELFEYLAISYNRPFMEFLMEELWIKSCYLVSICIEDRDLEFSYFEVKYMDETYLSGHLGNLYGEEFGMMSDFDYYPYGMVEDYKVDV